MSALLVVAGNQVWLVVIETEGEEWQISYIDRRLIGASQPI